MLAVPYVCSLPGEAEPSAAPVPDGLPLALQETENGLIGSIGALEHLRLPYENHLSDFVLLEKYMLSELVRKHQVLTALLRYSGLCKSEQQVRGYGFMSSELLQSGCWDDNRDLGKGMPRNYIAERVLNLTYRSALPILREVIMLSITWPRQVDFGERCLFQANSPRQLFNGRRKLQYSSHLPIPRLPQFSMPLWDEDWLPNPD